MGACTRHVRDRGGSVRGITTAGTFAGWTLERLGQVLAQVLIAGQNLFPRQLVSLAVPLFRNLQTRRRNRDRVMLAVDVDFPLQFLLELGRHRGVTLAE